MRKKLVVGNWKMNLDVEHSLNLVEQLDQNISASTKVEVVLCPSLMALEPLKQKLKPLKFKLGAQNLYFQDHGAYTGEVSASQLRGLVDYVILGHSERRNHFNENDDDVGRKVAAAVRNEMTPILCVGEKLYERLDEETAQVLHDQLSVDLAMLTTREVTNVVVAYEPVWAIGTGEIATPEHIKKALAVVRKTISGLYGSQVAGAVRVLYGGSVTPEFVPDYARIKDLDGFLVGGASLNYQDFAAIVKAVQAAGMRKPVKKVATKK
ncbi:triose-phosphate isomerase [Candidatus Microgenomates bacterium]|nr:triose-phosphate isomerase [Candidatus Microgenomates bacterium]